MDKRYPIGNFDTEAKPDKDQLEVWIEDIRTLPKRIQNELYYASVDQLNTPYREGGWTVSQVIHHLADSHMNALIRFKLALTEDNPTIKPFDENEWATTADYVKVSVKEALDLLSAVHAKWAAILDDMTEEDFERTFIHPAGNHTRDLLHTTSMYAWHGNHHLAQIRLVTKN